MKKIFLYLILFTVSARVFAQLRPDPELERQLTGKDRLADIMNTVDAYYKNPGTVSRLGADAVNRNLKHWKRWQWHMSRYVNADGRMVNTRAVHYQALRQAQIQERLAPDGVEATSGSWASIGPNAYNFTGGNYRGLGRVNRLAFHPSSATTVYAGTPNGGLWRTTNSGGTWTALDGFGPELGISGIVVSYANPSHLYVLTGDGDGGGLITNMGYRSYSIGVMKSTDGGINWQLQTNGLPAAGFRGYNIAQCPLDANVLILATDEGVYRTINGGNDWVKVFNNNFVSDVKFKPGSTTCYAAGDGWVRRSTDTGANWTAPTFASPPSSANRIQIAVTPANTNYVYILAGGVPASGQFTGVWRSTNSGGSFTRLATTPNILGNATDGQDDTDQSGYDLALAVSSTDELDVFTAGTTVWKSTNGGSSFSFSTTYVENAAMMPQYIHPDVHDVQVNPLNGHLWAATDGGVYRSTDNGATWTDLSDGISTAQPFHLDGLENNPAILYIGTQDNGLKNRYSYTSAWDHFAGADGFDVAIDYDDSARSYASINKSVLRYNNNGTTSKGISPGSDSWFANLAIHVTDPLTVFCGYGDDVYKSTNRGDDWTNTGASGSWCITTCPSNASRVYAAGGTAYNSATGALYRSDNGGGSWSIKSDSAGFPATFPKITSIGVNPTNSLWVWATFGGGTASAKVVFSSNGGNSWSNIQSTSLPNVPVNCIAVTSNNDVYIGTEIGVYYRPSGGTWRPFSNGLPRSPVSDIELNETASLLRVSLFGRGVWSSSTYSACPPTQLVAGTETGVRLYEASNRVASSGTTTVSGGYGTNVHFKGGQEVNLLPGFQAVEGSVFRAGIGDCGEGITLKAGETPNAAAAWKLPSTTQRLYPYGTITLHPVGTGITFRIHTPGAYALRVVSASGQILQNYPAAVWAGGKHETSFSCNATSKEMLYVQLLYNGTVVHYQELPPAR